jgi:hypothetical protein
VSRAKTAPAVPDMQSLELALAKLPDRGHNTPPERR